MNVDQFADLLHGVRRRGRSYVALCPNHNDHRPTLGFRAADCCDNKILVKCWVCPTSDVLDAMGLKFADIGCDCTGPRRPSTSNGPSSNDLEDLADYVHAAHRAFRHRRSWIPATTGAARSAHQYAADRFGVDLDTAVGLVLGVDVGEHQRVAHRPKIVQHLGDGFPRLVVPFFDADGDIVGLQARVIDDTRAGREGKARWVGPSGEGWARAGWFALELPDPIIITEGPSDALAAVAAGYPSVAIRGASMPSVAVMRQIRESLEGRQAVVAGDGDEAGRQFVRTVAGALQLPSFEIPDGADLAALKERTPAPHRGPEHPDRPSPRNIENAS